MRLHVALKFSIALLVALCPALAAAAELRLGVCAQDISPQTFPVHVSGDFFDRTADRVVMPLHARTFVLDDGTTKVVMCIIDSCGVGREMLDEIKALASKKTGITSISTSPSSTHVRHSIVQLPSTGPTWSTESVIASWIFGSTSRRAARISRTSCVRYEPRRLRHFCNIGSAGSNVGLVWSKRGSARMSTPWRRFISSTMIGLNPYWSPCSGGGRSWLASLRSDATR